MKEFFTGLLIFINFFSFSQSKNSNVIEATQAAYESQNPQSTLKELDKVSDIIKEVSDSLKVEYYLLTGTAYGQMGKADSSLYFLDIAEEIAEKTANEYGILKINNVKGLVYMSSGKYDESLETYQKAMKIGEASETDEYDEALRKVYGNSGGIYFELGQFEKALEVTLKAMGLSEKIGDQSGIAYNSLRLALTYNALNQVDDAITALERSSDLLRKLNDTATLIYSEITLGQYFEKQEDYDNALNQYRSANALAKTINLGDETAMTSISISRINLEKGSLQTAESFALQGLNKSKEFGLGKRSQEAHDVLYKINREQGNLEKALYHRNQYILISDSIKGVEMQSRVAELETKYETEKKEAEITRLSLENELQQANIRKAQIIQWAIVIVFIGSVIFTIVFFKQRSKKQKAENEAQELQIEALKKRFIELHASPSELAVEMSLTDINSKINTPLTEREFDALKLSIEGKTNTEISEILFISVSTVKFHLRNAYSKMGVGNRKEAFEYVLKTS